MNTIKHLTYYTVLSILLSCATSETQKIEDAKVQEVIKKEPLFQLNTKDTVSIEKCSCSVRKLPVESGAGAFGNAFLSNLTPESDREYELACKGKVTNKTQYKLQNVKFQWEFLSATKYPMGKSPIREYKNNYILPKSSANVSIIIGTDTGIKNYYTKEVKSYDCKIVSAIDVASNEIVE